MGTYIEEKFVRGHITYTTKIQAHPLDSHGMYTKHTSADKTCHFPGLQWYSIIALGFSLPTIYRVVLVHWLSRMWSIKASLVVCLIFKTKDKNAKHTLSFGHQTLFTYEIKWQAKPEEAWACTMGGQRIRTQVKVSRPPHKTPCPKGRGPRSQWHDPNNDMLHNPQPDLSKIRTYWD